MGIGYIHYTILSPPHPISAGKELMMQHFSIEEIKRFVSIIVPSETVIELRGPHSSKGTASGYFDDNDKLVSAICELNGKVPGVLVTMNPVRADLLARSNNRLQYYAEHTTSDTDILKRHWLLIDSDPVRPSNIPSTNLEHEAALKLITEIKEAFLCLGWPEPIMIDSGNGGHLLYKIDLPNDRESMMLIKSVLETLNRIFSNKTIKIDRGTFNAARLVRVAGSLNRKGDGSKERPHRFSRILLIPNEIGIVSAQMLREFVGCFEKPDSSEKSPAAFDEEKLERALQDIGIKIQARKQLVDGTLLVFSCCPWNPSHRNQSAFIIIWKSGVVFAKCHHSSCLQNDWRSLAEKLGIEFSVSQSNPRANVLYKKAWPKSDSAMFYGLAGEFVRKVAPETEADPVGLLFQFLAFAGNAAGRNPHLMVGDTRHGMNLFGVTVGASSKARKGTAKDHIVRLFEYAGITVRIVPGLSSGEGLIWAVRDPSDEIDKKTGEPVDPGIADKRLLVVKSEFSSVLKVMKRETNPLCEVICEAWDGGILNILTKVSASKATGAHISVVGHITQRSLEKHLTDTEAANGFGNRFLWLCVRRANKIPRPNPMTQEMLNDLSSRLVEAIEFATTNGRFVWSPEAGVFWDHVYNEGFQDSPGILGDLTARAEAQTLRLACIFALLDKSIILKVEHLKAALALWRYAQDSAAYLFGELLGDPLADELLRAIRNSPEGITKTALHKYFSGNKQASDLDRALGVLLSGNLARCESRSTEGRYAEVWFPVFYEKNEINEKSYQESTHNSSNSFNSSDEGPVIDGNMREFKI